MAAVLRRNTVLVFSVNQVTVLLVLAPMWL
jgi:hypothetical protein